MHIHKGIDVVKDWIDLLLKHYISVNVFVMREICWFGCILTGIQSYFSDSANIGRALSLYAQ